MPSQRELPDGESVARASPLLRQSRAGEPVRAFDHRTREARSLAFAPDSICGSTLEA